MNLIKPNILFVLITLFFSCSSEHKKTNAQIEIQPFSEVRDQEIQYVFNKLKEIYPDVLIKKNIEFPDFAWYPPRKRYRADSLIKFLDRNTTVNHIAIGITDKDISATKDSIRDWGIMGLSFCPGKACIASTFRLSRDEKSVQLFKVVIHELGHAFGLSHCLEKNCFMRDAEGRNTTDEENHFCQECQSFLTRKGWKFSK